MPETKAGLGWRPSRPHHQDADYRFSNALKAEMATEFPLIQYPQKREVDKMPQLDQGYSSGCTGYGTARHHAVERNVSVRSGTFIYAEARKEIGELNLDNGAYGRDAIAVAARLGVPRENLWSHALDPATNLPPNLFDDPSEKADLDASKRKAFTYHPLATRQEFRSCLERHTFCIGITCWRNMFDPRVERFGIIPPPGGGDVGGHWIWVVGALFDFRNSEYGKWGRVGRGFVPAATLESRLLAGDGQTLRGFSDESR